MRIRDIGDAVEQSFSAGIRNNGHAIYNLRINRLAFLEVNICADGIPFEVPCIALRDYLRALMRQENPRKLIKSLYEKTELHPYKSVDRTLRDAVLCENNLMKVAVGDGDSAVNYFCGRGAIFNSSLEPVMLCSWLLCRDSESHKVEAIEPIIRVDYRCFRDQADALQRLVSKKMLQLMCKPRDFKLLEYYANSYSDVVNFRKMNKFCIPKIEVTENKFTISKAKTPSIQVSSDALLKIAKEHSNVCIV